MMLNSTRNKIIYINETSSNQGQSNISAKIYNFSQFELSVVLIFLKHKRTYSGGWEWGQGTSCSKVMQSLVQVHMDEIDTVSGSYMLFRILSWLKECKQDLIIDR